jgi:hypothetical protein
MYKQDSTQTCPFLETEYLAFMHIGLHFIHFTFRNIYKHLRNKYETCNRQHLYNVISVISLCIIIDKSATTPVLRLRH